MKYYIKSWFIIFVIYIMIFIFNKIIFNEVDDTFYLLIAFISYIINRDSEKR